MTPTPIPTPGPSAAPRTHRAGVVVWGGLVLACLSGCPSGPKNFLNENDRLRSENIALRRRVQELEGDLKNQVQLVGTLQQQIEARTKLAEVSSADLPQVVGIRFGRYSGLVDTDQDGTVDTLRLYVQTYDQHGWFLPAIGPAKAQAVVIQPGQSPQIIAQQSLTPKQFERSYRSGITGSHFTLEIPFDGSLPQGVDQITVKVVLTDAATGVAHSHEQPISVRR